MASPVYADATYLQSCGVPPIALRDITQAQMDLALAQASRFADTYLGQRYTLPLTDWGDDLKQVVCQIAAFRILTFRGWKATDPVNDAIRLLYQEAVNTLKLVAQGIQTLTVVDTAPEPTYAPDAFSDDPRGI